MLFSVLEARAVFLPKSQQGQRVPVNICCCLVGVWAVLQPTDSHISFVDLMNVTGARNTADNIIKHVLTPESPLSPSQEKGFMGLLLGSKSKVPEHKLHKG